MRFLSALGYAFAIVTCTLLLIASVQGRHKETQLQALENDIASAMRDLHMLDVEWAYLTRPQRIAGLAGVYLPAMQPVASRQVMPALASLPQFASADTYGVMQSFEVSAVSPELLGALDFRE